MSDTFFGKDKKAQFDPEHLRNERLWSNWADMIMSGHGVPQEYIDKIVIPSTTNTLTAAGLGRSGAIGEAVAHATIAPQIQLMQSVLGGVPGAASSVAGGHQAGVFDWLDKLLGLAGAAKPFIPGGAK